jgi:REP element-mobilizing transposase RayT
MRHPPRFSLRIKDFDCSQSRAYFVTICAHERLPIFGEIRGGKLAASHSAILVSECWFELPYHYARLELGAFVVMPNHVHGLIALHDPVGAGLRPARRSDSVSEIVRAFKSFCRDEFMPKLPDSRRRKSGSAGFMIELSGIAMKVRGSGVTFCAIRNGGNTIGKMRGGWLANRLRNGIRSGLWRDCWYGGDLNLSRAGLRPAPTDRVLVVWRVRVREKPVD